MKNSSKQPASHVHRINGVRRSPIAKDCLDLDSFFLLSKSDTSFTEKALIVQHAFKCDSCSRVFLEYLELDDSIRMFCKNVDDLRRKKRFLRIPFGIGVDASKHRKLLFDAIIMPVLITLLIFMLLLPIFRSPYEPITRTSATIFFVEVYPKPYSSIRINSIFFAWRTTTDYSHSRISIFDSNLVLLYESDINENGYFFPAPNLKKLFYINSFYFWSIKSITNSGSSVESRLIPFKVIE